MSNSTDSIQPVVKKDLVKKNIKRNSLLKEDKEEDKIKNIGSRRQAASRGKEKPNIHSGTVYEGQSSQMQGDQGILKEENGGLGSAKKGVKKGKIKRKEKKILEDDDDDEEGADRPLSDSVFSSVHGEGDAERVAYNRKNEDIKRKLMNKISVSQDWELERAQGLQGGSGPPGSGPHGSGPPGPGPPGSGSHVLNNGDSHNHNDFNNSTNFGGIRGMTSDGNVSLSQVLADSERKADQMRGIEGGTSYQGHMNSSLSPTRHQTAPPNLNQTNQTNLDHRNNNHDTQSKYDNNVANYPSSSSTPFFSSVPSSSTTPFSSAPSSSSAPFFDLTSSTTEMGRHKVQDPRYDIYIFIYVYDLYVKKIFKKAIYYILSLYPTEYCTDHNFSCYLIHLRILKLIVSNVITKRVAKGSPLYPPLTPATLTLAPIPTPLTLAPTPLTLTPATLTHTLFTRIPLTPTSLPHPPRNFEADSIKCVKEESSKGVTLVLGKRRIRISHVSNHENHDKPDENNSLQVIAVLFDRFYFTEENSEIWWNSNKKKLL
jgi:hypothetical protein